MTKEQYIKLKQEGYYILISKGRTSHRMGNKKHIEYSLVKDEEEGCRSVMMYLNLKAKGILVNQFGFTVKKKELETVWLNHSGSMDFYTQTKEALIITFHN